MAIVQKSDGSTFYVDDAALAPLNLEPANKYLLREKLRALRDKLLQHPAPTNEELLAWAKAKHPVMVSRASIKAEIDAAQAAIDTWPISG